MENVLTIVRSSCLSRFVFEFWNFDGFFTAVANCRSSDCSLHAISMVRKRQSTCAKPGETCYIPGPIMFSGTCNDDLVCKPIGTGNAQTTTSAFVAFTVAPPTIPTTTTTQTCSREGAACDGVGMFSGICRSGICVTGNEGITGSGRVDIAM